MIRSLEIGDIDTVARLHFTVLGRSFNALIGEDHIRNLYREIIRSKYAFGFVFVSDCKIVGVAAGSTNLRKFEAEARKSLGFYDIFRILKTGVKSPVRLIGFLEFSLISRHGALRAGRKGIFLSIGVSRNQMRRRIGEKLTKKIIREFGERGFDEVYLFTERRFRPSNYFFQAVGFRSFYSGLLMNGYLHLISNGG